MNSLQAICYAGGNLDILNQLLLPQEFKYEKCNTCELAFQAIRSMKVRGAPAIAITAALALACELSAMKFNSFEDLKFFVYTKLDFLCESRPTAVNLFKMSADIKALLNEIKNINETKKEIILFAEKIYTDDINTNKLIGQYGASIILQDKTSNLNILTHCNTGSLATAGYGTALGIIRNLHEKQKINQVYATETRPYNQGARLTAFELVYEKIPSTLITDSMVSFLMKTKNIDAVVVGADRVALNGDTANKIGTYQIAVAANHHNVPFYVAAPTNSIDFKIKSGEEIYIEERPKHEVTHLQNIEIAARGIDVWNPSFDVTPAHLITGIVTEYGVILKNANNEFNITQFYKK